MSRRFPLDRRSFELNLSAFFQRMHRRTLRAGAADWGDPQTLPSLLQIQQKIEDDELDLGAVMDQVVKVTWRELGANGAGVWLFTDNEIFFCAGAGEASNDERLRLTVLAKLAATCQVRKHSPTQPGKTAEMCVPSSTAGPAPSYASSLLIEPISQDQKVAGVLAAFSSQLDGFTERDADKIQFLADLVTQALRRVGEPSRQYVALEPETMLELVEGMIPALQNMLSSDERPYISTDEFLRPTTRGDREHTSSRLTDDSPTSALHREANVPGTGEQATSESEAAEPSVLRSEIRSTRDGAIPFVRNGAPGAFNALMVAAARAANRVEQVLRHFWHTAHFRSPRPPIQLDLRRPQRFLFGIWAGANSHFKLWLQSRPSLLKAAPVLAALLMTIVFLLSKAGHYLPSQTKTSGPPTKRLEKTVAADVGPSAYPEIVRSDDMAMVAPMEAHVAPQRAGPFPIQVSHLRVTDRTTQDALRTLSHYELAALHRRALYGDDFAEFLIGMAYETGHGHGQDCKAAAEWVTKAASQGNAAAEYNLGLRYRDGDGVPVNQDTAVKWLRQAAARHIVGAQAALTAVAAQ